MGNIVEWYFEDDWYSCNEWASDLQTTMEATFSVPKECPCVSLKFKRGHQEYYLETFIPRWVYINSKRELVWETHKIYLGQHNWLDVEFCGKKTVAVDPWATGWADGTVKGGITNENMDDLEK